MSRLAGIEVTRLRWFVAVAEELHFARAAKALGIDRKRLSYAIKELEAELDTALFVPGARPTQLTEDGAALATEAEAVIAESTRMPEPEPRTRCLRVGFVPGVTVSKWSRIWSERFPEIELRTIAVLQRDQEIALRAAELDMCFVRLPIERDGMHAIPLYEELPVVVVPKEHPIALFDAVTVADLEQENRLPVDHLDDAGPAIELVAAQVGVTVVPHSIARLNHRRDVVYRTVTDLDSTQIALAWPSRPDGEADALVDEFIGVVRGRSARSSRAPQARTMERAAVQKDSKRKKTSTPSLRNVKPSGAQKSAGKKPTRRRGR